MSTQLEEVLRRIGQRLNVALVEHADEHWRWGLYGLAIDDPSVWPDLLSAARLEPDAAVAVGVVIAMVEKVPAGETLPWLEALSPGSDAKSFARQRADDVLLAQGLEEGGISPSAGDLSRWTDWLQRRLSETATRLEVLDLLASGGRTKRVRSLARSRGQVLRGRGS